MLDTVRLRSASGCGSPLADVRRAEKLDDLRAFAAPDVQQSHVRHAPAVPTLDELLGADEDIDPRVRALDVREQTFRDLVLLDLDLAAILFDEVLEARRIADVDKAEVVRCTTDLQPQLPCLP